MKKLSIPLAVAVATTVLSGCALYFGGEDQDNGTWNYCGSDGHYVCEGNDCRWVGPDCPDGSSGVPGGFECDSDEDCAAGCYCGDGICEEAGFCTDDSDCGEGFVCDESRSSCEPADTTPTPEPCLWDSECPQGQYCSPDTNQCTATCTCTDDEGAVAQGFGWCDETRNTCLPGQDPAGTCGGTPTCNQAQPTCPAGSVPTMIDGCWTGECQVYGQCDVEPVCGHINDEANCLGRSADCSPVYTGLNCTKPDGTACQSGDVNCTCASFVFASCRDRTASP